MAIVQISKIIHRTGANIDLPQLDTGEIGFSTDEQKLFIGNDPILHPVPDGQVTTQLELLTEVSNLDFAKVTGSANTELQLTSPKIGQLLVADGSSTTLIADTVVNWTGNLLGNGAAHSNNKLHLGSLANIEITGGMNGGVLSTDGAGNLYWDTVSGGSGSSLPSQTNNASKYLKTNGSVATWENVFSDTNFATTVRSNISVGYNSGYGNLSYSNSTGVITFTGPSISDIRDRFSAGTGVTYDSANGQISIAQDVSATASPTFDNLTLSNITVSGLYQVDDPQLQVPTVRNGIVYNNNSNTLATNNEFYYQGSVLHVGKVETLETITTGTTFKIANIDTSTKAPTDAGFKGEICWDANYIYVCTEGDGFTGTWEKIELGATVIGAPDLSSYATQTDVGNAIANLVNSSPATLDTLNELANALGNDASYSTTITTALGNKANSADLATVATSGSYTDLTGTPTLATVATSGSYTDLTGTPTLFDGAFSSLTGTPALFDGAYSSLTGTPTSIATVTSEAQPNITSVGTLTSLTVGNAASDTNTDVLSIVGSMSNLHISTDAGGGVSILSRPNQTGTGFYIDETTDSLYVLVGDVNDPSVANAVVKFQTAAVIPAFDSAIDLGLPGAAWKSITVNGNLNLGTGQFVTNTYTSGSDFDNSLVTVTNSGGYALTFTSGWQDTAPGSMVADLRGIDVGTLITFNGGAVTATATSIFLIGQEKIELQQVTGSLSSLVGSGQLTSISVRNIVVPAQGNIIFPDGTIQNTAYVGPPESAPKIEFVTAPSSNTDTGISGQIAVDSQYLYVCVGTNDWKRTQLTSW